MDSVNDDAKGVGYRRIEVLTGPGRRWRWSDDDKGRIIAEMTQPGAVVTEVARRPPHADTADLEIRPLGRPPEVPDAMILEAGQRLLAAGRTVTGYALRTTIGVGNQRRLVAVWERLRASNTPEAHEEANLADLPPGLVEVVQQTLSGFDAHIRRVILQIHRHVEATEHRRYQQEFDRLAEREVQAKQELRDAAEAVAQADAAAATLQQQVTAQHERITALSHRHAALEASLAALEQDRAILRAEVATLQAQLGSMRETAQKAAQAAAVAEAGREAAMSEAALLRPALDATTQRAHAAVEGQFRATEAAATAQGALTAAHAEIDRLRKECGLAIARAEALAARAGSAEANRDAAEARLAEFATRLAAAPGRRARRNKVRSRP